MCWKDMQIYLERRLKDLQEDFIVKYNKDKKLITIRHYTQESIDQVIGNQPVILEQKLHTGIRQSAAAKNGQICFSLNRNL